MLPSRILYYGKDEPLPGRVALRAGPLSLVWEEGDLRYIKLGGVEVVRRIYVAIRDRNWGTAPNVMSNLVMTQGDDSFHISYDVDNRLNEIHFTWHGEITGAADGTIRCVMDGVAQTTFMKNRIGYCILHPDDIAGARAVWTTPTAAVKTPCCRSSLSRGSRCFPSPRWLGWRTRRCPASGPI